MSEKTWTAKITGDQWEGELWLTTHDVGYTHALVKVMASTEKVALEAVTGLYEMLAGGRERYLRVPPEVTTEDDFESGKPSVRGNVRFSFRTLPGSEQIAAPLGAREGFLPIALTGV